MADFRKLWVIPADGGQPVPLHDPANGWHLLSGTTEFPATPDVSVTNLPIGAAPYGVIPGVDGSFKSSSFTIKMLVTGATYHAAMGNLQKLYSLVGYRRTVAGYGGHTLLWSTVDNWQDPDSGDWITPSALRSARFQLLSASQPQPLHGRPDRLLVTLLLDIPDGFWESVLAWNSADLTTNQLVFVDTAGMSAPAPLMAYFNVSTAGQVVTVTDWQTGAWMKITNNCNVTNGQASVDSTLPSCTVFAAGVTTNWHHLVTTNDGGPFLVSPPKPGETTTLLNVSCSPSTFPTYFRLGLNRRFF